MHEPVANIFLFFRPLQGTQTPQFAERCAWQSPTHLLIVCTTRAMRQTKIHALVYNGSVLVRLVAYRSDYVKANVQTPDLKMNLVSPRTRT